MTVEYNKKYLETGRKLRPCPGKRYENLNGSIYKCLLVSPMDEEGVALMQSCSSPNGVEAWTFTAIGIREYSDGRIDWAASINGRWEVRA